MDQRFDDIAALAIWLEQPAEAAGIRTAGVVLHLPLWQSELDRMVAVLNAFDVWSASDPPPSSRDWPPSDLGAFEAFVARETARVGGYVVFACSAARLAQRTCEHVDRILDRLDPAGAGARRAERERCAAQLRTLRRLRNKVFAHTAATDPRPEDSTALRATSAAYASGSGAGFRNDELTLGTVQYAVLGEPPHPADGLPSYSMREVREIASAAMSSWWAAIDTSMRALRARSDDELRALFPKAREITRT